MKSAKGRVSAPPGRAETREIMAAGPRTVLRALIESAKGRVSAPPGRVETRETMAAGPRTVLRALLKTIPGWLIAFVLLTGTAPAQQVKWNYDVLTAKASNTVDVSLSGSLLQFAARFLSDNDKDEAQVKKLIIGLKGIYVKNFEFKKPGEYTAADVESFRAPLHTADWERIVGVHSTEDGENVEVYIKNDGKKVGGLAIIATEPKQVTLVNIVGAIDLDTLSELGGHMGIPEIEVEKNEKKK